MAEAEDIARTEIERSLINASLFLASYHLLRNAIVDETREAFLGRKWDYARYEEQVLGRHESRFHASLLWLVERGALEASHVDEIHEIRRYRSKLAHDLPQLLGSPLKLDLRLLDRMHFFLGVLDGFFARLHAEDVRGDVMPGHTPEEYKSGGTHLQERIRDIVARTAGPDLGG